MLAPLLLFIISGIGMVSVVGVKMYQQAAGASLPLVAKRNAVESRVKRVQGKIQASAVTVKNTFHHSALERAVIRCSDYCEELWGKLKIALTTPGHWLDRHTRNLVSLVRGQQKLPEKGTPSSFLRDISRH
jgi:hypothetical protein